MRAMARTIRPPKMIPTPRILLDMACRTNITAAHTCSLQCCSIVRRVSVFTLFVVVFLLFLVLLPTALLRWIPFAGSYLSVGQRCTLGRAADFRSHKWDQDVDPVKCVVMTLQRPLTLVCSKNLPYCRCIVHVVANRTCICDTLPTYAFISSAAIMSSAFIHAHAVIELRGGCSRRSVMWRCYVSALVVARIHASAWRCITFEIIWSK